MQAASSWQLDDARRYFRGEWQQGFAWLAAGVLLGALAFAARGSAYAGAFWPLVVVSVIQLAAGGWLVAASSSRPGRITDWSRERDRVAGVNRTFVILEIVWAIAVIGGGIAAAVSVEQRGLCGGIVIAGAAMLAQDFAAHRRAKAYGAALGGASEQRARVDAMHD